MQRPQLDGLAEVLFGCRLPDACFVKPPSTAHVPSVEPWAACRIVWVRCRGSRQGAHDVPRVQIVDVRPLHSRMIQPVSVAHLLAEDLYAIAPTGGTCAERAIEVAPIH